MISAKVIIIKNNQLKYVVVDSSEMWLHAATFPNSPRRRTACAHAQFSRCSSMTNAHSETWQMAVCCRNLLLGVLSSHSTPSVLVGELFKKFGLFLNTGVCVKPQLKEHVVGEGRVYRTSIYVFFSKIFC